MAGLRNLWRGTGFIPPPAGLIDERPMLFRNLAVTTNATCVSLEPGWIEVKPRKPIQCRNCGAPNAVDKCEYCGTKYA